MALTFNSTFYYANRPDVLEAYLNSDLSVSAYDFALNHYNTFGWKEGANPNEVFNTNEYLDANPDLEIAGVNPFDHYNNHGQSEGRAPNATFPSLAEFDAETYLAMNPDLGIAGITTAEAAYDHYITFGYAENRPGAPGDAAFELSEALENLTAASEASASALETAALLDNANSPSPATGPALETFVANYDATAVAQELAEANAAVALATSNLAGARAVTSDAALATTQANALTAVLASSTALPLYNTRESARAERDADVAANGTDLEILTSLRDALVAEVSDGLANSTAVHSTGPVTVGALIDALNAEIANPAATSSAALIATIDGYDGLSALNGTAAEDIVDAVEARSDLNADVTAADSALAADAPAGSALVSAEAAVAGRQLLIDAVDDAQAYLAQYQAAADVVESAGAALEAATEALENLGYNAPVELAAGANSTTNDGDILLYNDPDTGNLISTVTGFGVDGDDLIFFGEGFTPVVLGAADNVNDAGTGNAGALEIFIKQVGANTILYVEDDSFDGSLPSSFDGNTITLVGVDASSLSFENGILRVVDTIA